MASLMPPNDYQHEDEEYDPSYHCFYVFCDKGVGQDARHFVNLVANAYEYVCCEDDIQKGLIRNQD